ncbi:MAG: riboflavin biosynthesis protein RibF [candidate division Zixibacteria bacterium]|nr:riboflavin biosynthesis protein RibF [candidate division Zixibacteria bacterium]
MEIIHNILDQDFSLEYPTTLTIGNFDGIHRGHISILKTISEISKSNDSIPGVITFDPHPLKITAPEKAPGLLTSTDEKLRVLEEQNTKIVILIPFDRRFSRYSANWFVEEILIRRLHAKHIVIGVNHFFGRNREGDVKFLEKVLPARGIGLDVVVPVHGNGDMVSSSKVRKVLYGGDFEGAVEMLGHSYPLFGKVVSGKGVGKTLGYPTINIDVEEDKIAPPQGVYACIIKRYGESVGGMLYIGKRPTFGGKTRVIEISCFCPLAIEVGDYIEAYALKYFRADMKFESKELLVEQIRRDEKLISSYLAKHKID